MDTLWFDGWSGLISILAAAPVLYLAVIAMIRLSGKRSTAQMNNFDWIVTVAMGSLVGTGLVNTSVSIAECLTAIGGLLLLQYIATLFARRSHLVRDAIKSTPRLVYDDGFLDEALTAERVTEEEVRAAIRERGHASITDVRWVVLETDGTFSVIAAPSDASGPRPGMLSDVQTGKSGAAMGRAD